MPAVEKLVLRVATPALIVPVPSVVAPSRNVTVPLAAAGDTVALSVVPCPMEAGFTLDASVVVVPSVFTTRLTVADVAAPVLAVTLSVPL